MKGLCMKRILPIFFVAFLGVLLTSSLALADKTREFRAYFGTETAPTKRSIANYTSTNTSPTNFNAANGQGGAVTLNGANMSFSTKYTGNPGVYTKKDTYPSSNTFVVAPDSTHQIKSIYYIRTDDIKSDMKIGDWTNVTPSSGKANAFTFTIDSSSKENREWHIWVVFEPKVAGSYSVDGQRYPCDDESYISAGGSTTTKAYTCCTTGKLDKVTPPVTTSVLQTGLSLNATPTFYISNSDPTCLADLYSDDAGASWSATNLLPVGGPYTSLKTDPIPDNYNFFVSWSGTKYTITSGVDASGSTTCGSLNPATNSYAAGSSQVFKILMNPGCAIDSVIVTDTNKSYSNTNVTASVIADSNSYTFNSIAAAGSITVKFKVVEATTGTNYCQVPSFLGNTSTLKPNVLVIYDNSGSMSNYPYLDNSAKKPYSCDTAGKTTVAPTGVACTLSNVNNFYGYFAPSTMYSYNSSTKTFTITNSTLDLKKATSVSKCSDIKNGSVLSGNYLNYLCMQKTDVVKKILVGGKVDGTAGAARPVAPAVPDGTTSFYLRTAGGMLVESGKPEPTGLVHDVFNKVRFGLMTFNANGSSVGTAASGTDGGEIIAPLGSDLPTIVESIEDVAKNGFTPLAESFFEAIRYFKAEGSAYNGTTYANMDPIQYSCQKHFVLMLTDGEPTNDGNVPTSADTENVTDAAFTAWYNGLAAADKPAASFTGTTFPYLPRLTYYAHNNDLRTATLGKSDLAGKQNITFYAVYAFGDGSGTAILKEAAKFGAYTDINGNNKPDAGEYNNTFFEATDGDVLESSLSNVFGSIISSTASGTAAAVANNKSGERGANILQALFYPQWPSDGSVKWLGEMQALWYYLDPIISYSSIYEDTDGNKELNLFVDKAPPTNSFNTKALWRAGAMLQKRDAADRKIYTPLTSSALTDSTNEFKTTNLAALRPRMNLGLATDTGAISDTQAGYLIDYIRGTDRSEYRPRKVSFLDPSTNALNTALPTEWKLGDIINSTPSVQSSIALNSYDKVYGDQEYSKFIKSNEYKARNVVYTSSNEGMLHAFRLGLVTNINSVSEPNRVARIAGTDMGKEEWAFIPKNAQPYLQNQAGVEYCHQCLVDGSVTLFDASIAIPSSDSTCGSDYPSCTRTTNVTTAGNLVTTDTSWRTVLINGMGLGGASRDVSGNCNQTRAPYNADAVNNKDCVKTPKTDIGLSSYFALDVTDPLVPKYMWEFSDYSIALAADKGLGFTTAGAAIMRTNAQDVSGNPLVTKNGRWFAVFASGPTGPIENKQFLGRSDQNLKIYIVDINATMPFTKGTNYWVKDTGIKYAFANSMSGSVVDLDRWKKDLYGYYSDDVAYISYTKASMDTSASPGPYPTAWDKGGVIRLVTNNDPNPDNWFLSSLIDDTGPITSSIGKIQDRDHKKLWVYFGEGRYFHSGDEVNTTRKFYGVEDPCYTQYSVSSKYPMQTSAAACPAVDINTLQDQGGTPPVVTLDSGKKGWYISMDAATGTKGAERVVSDVTAAMNGIVFYTTFTPNTDVCVPGGTTSVWAVKYDTGGTPPAGSLVGKAPVQTSSGGITLVDLSTQFTDKSGRKLNPNISTDGASLQGVASSKGIRPLMLNKAIKKIMHMQEQ